jgi:hypothetical protein
MSEHQRGDGWWMASDGNWYPPELHPSARDDATDRAQPANPVAVPERPASEASGIGHVGPQFPDLFQTAVQGNHLADSVSVKYDGDDERNVPVGAVSSAPRANPSSQATADTASGGSIGDFTGASAKRRWRRH